MPSLSSKFSRISIYQTIKLKQMKLPLFRHNSTFYYIKDRTLWAFFYSIMKRKMLFPSVVFILCAIHLIRSIRFRYEDTNIHWLNCQNSIDINWNSNWKHRTWNGPKVTSFGLIQPLVIHCLEKYKKFIELRKSSSYRHWSMER